MDGRMYGWDGHDHCFSTSTWQVYGIVDSPQAGGWMVDDIFKIVNFVPLGMCNGPFIRSLTLFFFPPGNTITQRTYLTLPRFTYSTY